jgi:outer membrane lipoprotein-sorting protein
MKLIYIMPVLCLLLLSSCTDSQVKILAQQLETSYKNLQDYSAVVVTKNMKGEVTEIANITFKKPDKYRVDWIKPDKGTDITFGTDRYSYDKSTNTLYSQKVPQEDLGKIDFQSALRTLVNSNKVAVMDDTFDGRPVYKITVTANENPDYREIYYVDKESVWIIKQESMMSQEKCAQVKATLKNYAGYDLNSCSRYSYEMLNYTFNQKISDDVFNIQKVVPNDISKQSGFGKGTCGQSYVTAKPLDEGTFKEVMPVYVPDGYAFKQAVKPDVIPDYPKTGDSACRQLAAVKQYLVDAGHRQTSTAPYVDTDYEIAILPFENKLTTQLNGDTMYYQSTFSITESDSSLLFLGLGLYGKNIEEVSINGNKGYYFVEQHGSGQFLYWAANGLYFEITKPAYDPKTEALPGMALSKEELIKVAESMN